MLCVLAAGYLIPKGWKVMPLFRNIHHSPDHFPCPEKFDPSRFEVRGLLLRHLCFSQQLMWVGKGNRSIEHVMSSNNLNGSL